MNMGVKDFQATNMRISRVFAADHNYCSFIISIVSDPNRFRLRSTSRTKFSQKRKEKNNIFCVADYTCMTLQRACDDLCVSTHLAQHKVSERSNGYSLASNFVHSMLLNYHYCIVCGTAHACQISCCLPVCPSDRWRSVAYPKSRADDTQ